MGAPDWNAARAETAGEGQCVNLNNAGKMTGTAEQQANACKHEAVWAAQEPRCRHEPRCKPSTSTWTLRRVSAGMHTLLLLVLKLAASAERARAADMLLSRRRPRQ